MKHEDQIPKGHTLPPQGDRGQHTYEKDVDSCTGCAREEDSCACEPAVPPVPAEPRSAEEFWPEWQKRNSDIGVLHYWVRDFAEAYAATLREQIAALHEFSDNAVDLAASRKVEIDSLKEQLAAVERENAQLKRTVVADAAVSNMRQERYEKAEAALLSAQKESLRLRLALVQTMRAVEHIFDCEPEDQEGQAQGAVAVARAALAQNQAKETK
jgi:hypothetical protein